jgi:hypothetical protein
MTYKVKLFGIFLLGFIFVLFAVMFIKFAYQTRCSIFVCSPASWEEILNMALIKAGNNYRIDSIEASPSRRNSYTETGPSFLDIEIVYVSSQKDNYNSDGINYPVKFLRFDDRNMWASIQSENEWHSNHVPSADSQEIIKRVRVHPRDAISTTWLLARKATLLPSESATVSAHLQVEEIRKEDGCESVWVVSYYYNMMQPIDLVLIYHVNAQSGQVVFFTEAVVN